MPKVPLWLQIILGVFSLLEPGLAWLAPIIEALWEIFQELPLLKKPGALLQMRKAVKQAKLIKNIGPLEQLSETLKPQMKKAK
jgi:hypothetical protein